MHIFTLTIIHTCLYNHIRESKFLFFCLSTNFYFFKIYLTRLKFTIFFSLLKYIIISRGILRHYLFTFFNTNVPWMPLPKFPWVVEYLLLFPIKIYNNFVLKEIIYSSMPIWHHSLKISIILRLWVRVWREKDKIIPHKIGSM